MAFDTNIQPDNRPPSRHYIAHLLSQAQLRITVALLLIATGIVFLLGEGKLLDYSSPWWVIYIAIPGLVLVGSAASNYYRLGTMTGVVGTQLVMGLIAILLSLIFVFDPTWSFTRGWGNWHIPILDSIDWGHLWPWFLVVPGAGLVYTGLRQHALGTAVFGGILVVVGGVFIFNISWNAVWPLAIVALGVAVLFGIKPRR
ncbi:MAG TPA: hypothetical protein VMT34_00390 [Aggregatilineales bacterium]|nr:hypothetical protein [Aggregatilineales bacterium]